MTTTTAGATTVKVVHPGEGEVGGLISGVGVQFKIDGADTGGLVSIVEHPFDVGAIVPPHVHRLEDEISYVLEGEIGFRSEDDEVVLPPGGYIVKPRGQVHAMWNAGQTPARMIEVITTPASRTSSGSCRYSSPPARRHPSRSASSPPATTCRSPSRIGSPM
jgi:quercetin dioxygenase-like cupin family protein